MKGEGGRKGGIMGKRVGGRVKEGGSDKRSSRRRDGRGADESAVSATDKWHRPCEGRHRERRPDTGDGQRARLADRGTVTGSAVLDSLVKQCWYGRWMGASQRSD